MEAKEILRQRYRYAEIKPYKDYSRLVDRPKNLGLNTFDVEGVNDECDIFSNVSQHPKGQYITEPLRTKTQLPPKSRNTKFFYTDEECDVRIALSPYFKNRDTYLTTNDRHIKRHYNRPFSSINMLTFERSIYQKNDTITVKVGVYSRNRYFNCKYFRANWENRGFSINLKTGNITTFSTDKQRTQRSVVRRNTFPFLLEILNGNFLCFEERIRRLTLPQVATNQDKQDRLNVRAEFTGLFDDREFINTLNSFFLTIPNFKPQPLPNTPSNSEIVREWLLKNIINLFVKIKSIKVPDNFDSLIVGWYPTKKYLKRNDNKLIAAILDRLQIKSKQTIRILHENPEMDITRLFGLTKYFGNDFHQYLGNIDSRYFKGIHPKIKYASEKKWYEQLLADNTPYNISDDEKSNVLKLLNETIKDLKTDVDNSINVIRNANRLIDDHFRMILKIKEYYPDISLKATNWKNFNEEHVMLSRLERLIRKGYTTEFVFEDELVEYIQKPIFTEENTYYPILLKADSEYTEEGAFMHHCVGGYAERGSSIIVSLRMGSDLGSERVTCEYSTQNKEPMQCKYFCNGNPPVYFTEALRILHARIFTTPFSIKAKELLRKKIEINGFNLPIPVNENAFLDLI